MVNGELGSTDNGKKVLINFRISLEEKKKLQAKAKQAHMSISSYIIALSENKKITVAENIPELLLEITRIGTNINQIAHIGNSQKYVNKQQLDEVLNLLEDIESIMQKYSLRYLMKMNILLEVWNEK